MQVTIFIALMASLVLASPIGRYRSSVLRPRYPQEGAPYANSTSSISASASASSGVASDLMFILPSTDSTPSQSFSSAVVPPRSFQNVRDEDPTSTLDAPSLTTITFTKTIEPPVKTTKTLLTSSTIPKVTSSASRKSFVNPSDTADKTSVVAVPGTTVVASSKVMTGSTSDAVVTPSTSSGAVTDSTVTASAITGSTSDAVVTPSASSKAVSDNTLTASTITGSTSDAVVTPSTSSGAVTDSTVTASTITGSTSDAVVTPSASSKAVPDNTLTASAITGLTSDVVVTTSASDIMSSEKYEPTSALLSSVRFPVGTTKPIASSKPAATSATIATSESVAATSVATVTSEPVASKPITTSAATVTSGSVTATSAAIITSEPVATTKPTTTSAAIITSEPAVTSGSVTPTVSASQQSTATTSTEASPSAIAGDTFGNKQLAISENKGFAALTPSSKCDPAKLSTQNACIGGAFAQCGSNGVYIIVSPCAAPTKCFSMPMELSAGTSVGCTTPDDAAYRMGLSSAAELKTLISRRHVVDGTPVDLAPTAATSAAGTAQPVGTSAAISSASQEPKIPVPSDLKTSEVRSPASTTGCASSAPIPTTVAAIIDTPLPTAAVSSASQEPKIPVPSDLKTSEVRSPTSTADAGDYASSVPVSTATIDTSLPAKTTTAVSFVSQEPKLLIPSGLLTSEIGFLPTSTVASSSITSAPVPGPSTVTITVATTVTIKG